jgi:adenosylcobinamide kinase/adenosylcobinamide-phosphate guanylyltransferase
LFRILCGSIGVTRQHDEWITFGEEFLLTGLAGLTLVFGGAASGKSRFGEDLVLNTGLSPVYLATAQAHDAEMEAKIAKHKSARAAAQWRTVEVPTDIPTALMQLHKSEAVLIDCATLWLANLGMTKRDWRAEWAALARAIANCPAPVVIISNELGMGVVPDHPLSRAFRQDQGELNQAIAAAADLVVMVAAGLPLVLKGQLPKGQG